MTPVAEWDDLARLAQAATPGPWEATQEGLTHPDGWEIDAPDGPVVSECCGYMGSVGKTADAEFIAAANPGTILRLIEEHRALAARLAAVEALAERWCHCGDPGDPRRQAASALRAALAAPTDTTKEN